MEVRAALYRGSSLSSPVAATTDLPMARIAACRPRQGLHDRQPSAGAKLRTQGLARKDETVTKPVLSIHFLSNHAGL